MNSTNLNDPFLMIYLEDDDNDKLCTKLLPLQETSDNIAHLNSNIYKSFTKRNHAKKCFNMKLNRAQ